MDYNKITDCMKKAGVRFSPGLENDTITKIEEIYKVRFPRPLTEFYKTGLPVSRAGEYVSQFPIWDDFSQDNINNIRQRMKAPYQWLKNDIEKGFGLVQWNGKTTDELFENAPKLIPIYSHRYMPVLNGEDSPVISTVGRDTVFYGVSLEDYLMREFCNGDLPFEIADAPYVVLWSDIAACS